MAAFSGSYQTKRWVAGVEIGERLSGLVHFNPLTVDADRMLLVSTHPGRRSLDLNDENSAW